MHKTILITLLDYLNILCISLRKYNIAARCYAAMSVGCDHMTSEMLASSFAMMMYKVGDKCETTYASPCHRMEKMKCDVKEAEECLEGLHEVVVAGRKFLPSSANRMCMYVWVFLQMFVKCVRKNWWGCYMFEM